MNAFLKRIAPHNSELIALAILAPLALVLGALLIHWPAINPANLPPPTAAPPASALSTPASSPAATAPAAIATLVVESPSGVVQVPVTISDHATAADLLAAAQTQGQITAVTKDFGGELGIFVEEINGVANDPKSETYWFLYVNGVKSPLGASSAAVRTGDVATWRYEKEEPQ
ncbi:MAG: DUF4430 domain-containing protein [Candidatus Andersenbacteria bacterium]|nr:DUF4430 domain-containing protein [Candidatus Andersenbacteria bacterium]